MNNAQHPSSWPPFQLSFFALQPENTQTKSSRTDKNLLLVQRNLYHENLHEY